MKRTLMAAAADIAIAAAAFTGTAQAQCAWTGFGWSCPQPFGAVPQAYAAYPYSGFQWPDGGYGYYTAANQYSSGRYGPDPGSAYEWIGFRVVLALTQP